jgi:CelD/BcsL family acetyltransferase involved in cellulose biosynthesis
VEATLSPALVEPSERAQWSRLAERSGSIYATPEWLEAWWREFGGGRRLVVERVRDAGGRLVAILPLYVWSSTPLRVLRFIAHGPSDELGAVAAPEDRPLAVAALREVIRREEADAFVGEELANGEEWSVSLGGRMLRRRPSPVLRIDGRSWGDFLASHGRATRQKIRAGDRKVRRGGLSYRLTGSREELVRDLDALFALHAARFPRGTSGFGWDARLQAFHREFAQVALERGWLRLWLLERDGAPVAAHYGFCYGDSHYGYSGGWDPRQARLTPGKALLLHAMRQAFEEGAADFRFLRGGEAYKYWYATGDHPVDTIAVTNGVLPRVALDTYYSFWRLREGSLEVKRRRRRG